MENICKICRASSLTVYAHTATCNECGVLLYYPYPKDDEQLVADGEGKQWTKDRVIEWYSKSSFYNHSNFTNMLRFAIDESYKSQALDILDYGGGGGQFALVCKSHFLESNVYLTDISDRSLLEQWQPLNKQILFKEFDQAQQKFDFIFMNDVFEHLSDPLKVLKQLAEKLKPNGKIFVDTPKQFWLYPATKLLSKQIYTKLLNGTVSTDHLQIWSKKSFESVVQASGLKIVKYKEASEYTMPADFYLKNMTIHNSFVRAMGKIFYMNAKWLAKNKIVCLLSK
ncbi:MAG: class I SAM-dependent methyltransferase [Chroococcus sp. CMT-3BRIN-NPC107]|jgi:2-polyprenyl-3-methyl-5-hydroxy-6-metoxy-1,4-benzoquinol methylase|nr:class I SAM-dependent methyltransferase [Chroococcus sp. CMT-3BRIN-NPC107]